MYIVYKHTSPSKKNYIGITNNSIQKRANYDGSGYKGCTAFYRAIQKYGWKNFTTKILAQDLTEEEAKRLEKYYIKLYDTRNPDKGYNISAGGDGYSVYNEEEIIQLWNKGFGVTEIIEQIGSSKTVVQKVLTSHNIPRAERVQRGKDTEQYDNLLQNILQLWNEGKTVEEIRNILKIEQSTLTHGLTKLGIDGKERIKRSAGKYHQKKVYQFDKQGNFLKEYESIAEAGRQNNIQHNNIIKVCKGERKTAGGYKWSYYKE